MEAEIIVPGTSPVPVLVGALGQAMVRAAGELADGVVTWLAGPRILEDRIVPDVAKAATEGGRGTPRIVVGLPVAVTDEGDAAREAAGVVFARYAGLANYQRVMARQGVASPADVIVFGDEAEVERGLRRFADAGVTEVWPVPFPVGDDPSASLARTRRFLDQLCPIPVHQEVRL